MIQPECRPESHREPVEGAKGQSDGKEAFKPQRPGVETCKKLVSNYTNHLIAVLTNNAIDY